MPRTMLDERKAAILKAVVEEYIETALPVGSGHIVRSAGVQVSSATVRNDMVVLEQEGFLRQPHTSAGRVPTDKGYRFFVDHLAGLPHLAAPQAQQVRTFFQRAHGELERMLADTSRLLSDLTDYAAVVVGPPHEAATVRSVQIVVLGPSVALVVAVLSNGVVEKHSIDIDEECDEERVAAAATSLAAVLGGRTLADMVEPGPTGDPVTDRLVRAAARTLASGHREEGDAVFVGGASRMAVAFDAVDTVRTVLGILEEQYVVVSLLRDVLDRGLNVAIGSETGMAPLAECSVVVAPYLVEGELAGSVGVLGPTRMNYPQAMAAVAVVSKRLGRRLTEG